MTTKGSGTTPQHCANRTAEKLINGIQSDHILLFANTYILLGKPVQCQLGSMKPQATP